MRQEDFPRNGNLDGSHGLVMIPPVMSWYYSKNGTQLGPVAEAELSGKIKSGEVATSDLVWQEGMGDWKPASQVPAFQGSAPLSIPPVPQGNLPMAQPPAMTYGQYPQIPNYLWQSIVVTILCCMPFGVVGIVYAAKVDGMVAGGDLVGAQAASQSAKTWTLTAFICGLVINGIFVALMVIGAAQQA